MDTAIAGKLEVALCNEPAVRRGEVNAVAILILNERLAKPSHRAEN